MELLGDMLPWVYAFVGYWPLMMMLVWVIGGIIFFRLHEAGGRRDVLPPTPSGPRVSIIIPASTRRTTPPRPSSLRRAALAGFRDHRRQ